MERLIRVFIRSCGVLLLITASAKIISTMGSARILNTNDPIAMIPFRYMFLGVGTIEIAVALFCFVGRKSTPQLLTILWLASNFLLYRIGLVVVGYHRPCNCLGNLTDALPLSSDTIEVILRIILVYLLTGSYLGLLWTCKKRMDQKGRPATGL